MNREDLLFSVRTLAHSLDAASFANLATHTHSSDLVEALDILNTAETVSLLLILAPLARAELFAHIPEKRQDTLLRAMPRDAVVELFEHMPSDDRADLYNRLSEGAKQKLLPALAKVERDDIIKLAAYPDGTVGSVTTSDYVRVSPEMTGASALDHIRATAPDKETIYVIYVLDQEQRLAMVLGSDQLETEVLFGVHLAQDLVVRGTGGGNDLLALKVVHGLDAGARLHDEARPGVEIVDGKAHLLVAIGVVGGGPALEVYFALSHHGDPVCRGDLHHFDLHVLGAGLLAHRLCQLEAQIDGIAHRFFVGIDIRKRDGGFAVPDQQLATGTHPVEHACGMRPATPDSGAQASQ